MSCLFILSLYASQNNILYENKVRADSDLVIVLDPGHGGKNPGAVSVTGIGESIYNEKLAKYVAQELENYEGVTVYFTRYETLGVIEDRHTLLDRIIFAKDVGADLFVSLHCNGSEWKNDNGVLVILSKGEFKPELNVAPATIGPKILERFHEEFGLYNEGILLKDSKSSYYDYIAEDGTRYNADYYGVIRNGVLYDIPSMLIEHGYLSNESDTAILDDDDNLRKMGYITATEIADYYGLEKREDKSDANLVELKSQAEVFMSSDIPDTVYANDGRIKLEAYGGSGDGEIFFESSDWAIFTIDGDYAVITENAGSAEITAIRRTDGVYCSNSSKGYTITVLEATERPTPSPTPSPTPTPTLSPSPTPSSTPSPSPSPTPSPSPSPSPTPTPTLSPSPTPSSTPPEWSTPSLTAGPTFSPSEIPPVTPEYLPEEFISTPTDSSHSWLNTINENYVLLFIFIEAIVIMIIIVVAIIKAKGRR